MNKFKKAMLIIGPIIGAGLVIYLVNRKKKTPVPATEADVKDTTSSPPKPASGFPLKNGSRGEKVSELQGIIGASVDGIFGSETLGKLKSFAGVSVVNSQAELDALKLKKQGKESASRAKQLFDMFKSNTALQLYTSKQAVCPEITTDTFGAISETGKYLTLAANKIFNRQDYTITTYTQTGKLVFTVNRGGLAGTYMVDPNLVSLK